MPEFRNRTFLKMRWRTLDREHGCRIRSILSMQSSNSEPE
jgi:hypothetical protein